jgi:dihydroflavonol-4-reductase
MPKRIAITGASGHLGTALINPLLQKGHSIQAQYRSSVPQISHDNLHWAQGEITDLVFLKELFKDCDVVIHCAGMISLSGNDNEQVFDTNITGTSKVIEAILAHDNIKLIHISSTNAVDDIPQTEAFDESSQTITNKNYAYGYSKAKSEQLVLDVIRDKHLNAIILRPSALLGPPDYNPSLVGQSVIDLINGKIPALPSGGYDYVDIRDVANTIINSIEHGKSGEIYNLTGKYYSLKAFTKMLSNVTNKRISPLIIPIPLMVCLLPLANLLSLFMKQKSAFTYESLMTLKYGHKNMNNTKAIMELSHQPRHLQETLKDLIEWFENENLINDN